MTYPSGRPTEDAVAMMRYDANKKSVIVAYLLWFFLGMFGMHRFYLGRWFSGLILLLFTLVAGALYVVLVGMALMAIPGLWWLIDALLIPGMTRSYNNELVDEVSC
ncbi:MAG: TM2 domain-containing protein [Alphaproteobacteria bacterium]|nr:TM2 domain-containing protein [Alphaproteobacteria bacterium]